MLICGEGQVLYDVRSLVVQSMKVGINKFGLDLFVHNHFGEMTDRSTATSFLGRSDK